MKQAYFDESADTQVFLMAGWIGDEDEFKGFNEHWLRVLAEDRAIRYFKNHDALSFEGEFTGWPEADRDAKLMALAKVIANYDLRGIAGGIKLATLREVLGKSIASKRVFRNIMKYTEPYEFCFHGVIGQVLQQELAKGKDRIEFIVDDHTMAKDCISLYQEMMSKPDEFGIPRELVGIAGTIKQASDTNTPALQAADLLAGQMISEMKGGKKSELLHFLGSVREIAMFQSFPPGFEKLPTQIEMLNRRLTMKADLTEEKRRMVREGKWDEKEGWD
jgi:hypothetical protein